MITRTDERSRRSTSGSAMIALTIAGASQTVVTLDRSSSSTTARRVEDPVDDRGGTRGDERRRGQVERPDVVERPAGQTQVRVREPELHHVGQVLPGQVPVRDHHALRTAGGSRRVHEPVDVVGLGE